MKCPGPGGSSPRVRGTGKLSELSSRAPRFIPACAGNSTSSVRETYTDAVHPRVCGEQILVDAIFHSARGSSPRVRGTGRRYSTIRPSVRFIPACAGNSNGGGQDNHGNAVHPRVCGEQIFLAVVLASLTGSSPRVRGTANEQLYDGITSRFIPACAGNSFF